MKQIIKLINYSNEYFLSSLDAYYDVRPGLHGLLLLIFVIVGYYCFLLVITFLIIIKKLGSDVYNCFFIYLFLAHLLRKIIRWYLIARCNVTQLQTVARHTYATKETILKCGS